IIDRAPLAERMIEADPQSLDPQDRRAHAAVLRRGLAISSSPKVRKNRPRKTIRMMTVGASHHHHQPLIIAALKLTQYKVMPSVGASIGPRPRTSRPIEARIAAETALTKVAARYGRRFGISSKKMMRGPLIPESCATST